MQRLWTTGVDQNIIGLIFEPVQKWEQGRVETWSIETHMDYLLPLQSGGSVREAALLEMAGCETCKAWICESCQGIWNHSFSPTCLTSSCLQVMLCLNNCEQLEANLNGWFVFTAAANELTSWKTDTVIFCWYVSLLLFPGSFCKVDFLLWANKEFLLHTVDLLAKGKEDALCSCTELALTQESPV